MAGKFNNLEDVRNTFLAANFDFNTLPANNKYRKYKEFKEDPDKRKLPDGAVPTRPRDVPYALSPFGLDFATDNDVRIMVSGRVNPVLGASLGGVALYNLTASPDDGVLKRVGFVPSKAIITVRLSTPTTVAASENRITGRAYKTRSGDSYTVPFGAASATDREFEVQNEIVTALTAGNYITFTPEKLKRS